MSVSVVSIGIKGLESVCATPTKILPCFLMGFVRIVWLQPMQMGLVIHSAVFAQTDYLGIPMYQNACVQPEAS